MLVKNNEPVIDQSEQSIPSMSSTELSSMPIEVVESIASWLKPVHR
jgi:hypothetical protein